jgi:hypothetical protein
MHEEIQSEINAYQNLLEQKDYTARKVAFEVAKLFKAQFPNTEMPEYEKYLDGEIKAETFRENISNLKES